MVKILRLLILCFVVLVLEECSPNFLMYVL